MDECNSSGIKNDVIFTGYCSNIPLMQTIIDIQVFPSLWEGTPLTLFEAMAMKKAIVSTNIDGLGEILENGRNALVVPARNAELIASSIESLILDSDMKERLSEKAQKDSFKYDIQNTVNRMQTIYRKLLSGDTDKKETKI
jgi:glycosyltransferase involved in cell wall biosynthesis